ncbi:MAG TPA: LTA synthase family protein, partial [candidate division Zixibacteria bacterium]|nr:LTA synthase family protein [candidate division Zixibacteria bacterium]
MPRSTAPGDRYSGVALPHAFILIVFIYLLALAFFTLFRLFFLANYAEFVAGVRVTELLTAFGIGWRFDQIVILIILAPLLLALPWIRLKTKLTRRILASYLTLAFSLCFLLLFADVRFYSVFDAHLNFLVYENLFTDTFVADLAMSDPDFWLYVFLWMVVTALFAVLACRLIARLCKTRRTLPWWNRLGYFVLFTLLFAIGIRGRVGLAPMDWGVAYFSHDRFLNQLALNGVYTLGRNLWERDHDPRLSNMPGGQRFPFMKESAALKSVQGLLGEENDTWLDPDSNLSRRTLQPSLLPFKPNVVIVVMETWQGLTTGALGDIRHLTPHFDSLAAHGILFTNFYASGTRTAYGLSAILCSFPSLPGRAILKRYTANHPFVTLPTILHDRGYTNAFVYGGDFAFDNIEGFFRQHHYDRFYGYQYFPFDERFSKWGIPDKTLFDHVAALVDSIPRPFQFTVLTLSNHEPYDLPDSSVRKYMNEADSSKMFNSQIYADYALGAFMDELRAKSVFDSTIFLFVSDHGHYTNSPYPLDPRYFHIPLLIYSPAIIGDSARREPQFGGQVDILPTLLGLLGGNYTQASWGRNLLNLPRGD